MVANKTLVPPLKIQGIKTKLVPAIKQYATVDPHTQWVEPFMGSGVVGFNVAPPEAVFADINPHIINFYLQIQSGKITPTVVREYLEEEGRNLSVGGVEYYIQVRQRFNTSYDPLDFLFLNRSCFNGMMRFNKDNQFNVPYGHKPDRFAKAYITKIVNQVAWVEDRIKNNHWVFKCQPFEKTIADANEDSFIYCDPPYIGRHVDYYDSWDVGSEQMLKDALVHSRARYMVSTWFSTSYRTNEFVQKEWSHCHVVKKDHFYHVGAKEANRNAVVEALLLNYLPNPGVNQTLISTEQISYF